MSDDDAYVALAEVTRPHGIRGELRLNVFNPDSELLLRRPPIRLVTKSGEVTKPRISAARKVPGALLVRLDGVADRNQAELLRGARIEVSRERLAATDDDEFYQVDLEGCLGMLAGAELGVVLHVSSYPTMDVLVIERSGAARLEVPIHGAYVETVSVEEKRIELSNIEGLE